MEKYQIWTAVYAILSGITVLIFYNAAIYTPGWTIAKYEEPSSASYLNNYWNKDTEDGQERGPAALNISGGTNESLLRSGSTQDRSSPQFYRRYCRSTWKHEFYVNGVAIRNGIYVTTICQPPISSAFAHGPLWLCMFGGLFMFIGWIWSLSTFCCGCCGFYLALPLFAGLSCLLLFVGITMYGIMSKDEIGGIFTDHSFGYSFGIMICVTIIAAVLIVLGLMAVVSPKPPRITHVQPIYGGGYGQPMYGEGGYYGPQHQQPMPMHQQTYPASYYQKPKENPQPVEYPM